MESNNDNLIKIVNDPVNSKYEPLKANNPIERLKEQAGSVSDYSMTLIGLGVAGASGAGILGLGIKTDEPVYYALGGGLIAATAAIGYLYHRLVGRNQLDSQ